MAKPPVPNSRPSPAALSPVLGAYLDMPFERREMATAHAAMLSETMARVALTLPLGADVDDFRRVLVADTDHAARKGSK